MDKMRGRTCCFTGHRELPAWGHKELAAKLEDTIIGLIDRGIRFYGAGGARGWDALAAQTVLRLKGRYPYIKLILIHPGTAHAGRCRNSGTPCAPADDFCL